MREQCISQLKVNLDSKQAIIINRKESIQYYFNVSIPDGMVVSPHS